MRSQANTWTCYKKNVEFKKPFLLCSDCMIPFTTMHINTDTDTHLYSEFAWSLLNTKYTCRAVDLWKLMELIYGSYILKRIDFLNGLQTNAQTPVVVWVTIEHSPSPKLIRNIVFSKDNEDGAYLPLALYKKIETFYSTSLYFEPRCFFHLIVYRNFTFVKIKKQTNKTPLFITRNKTSFTFQFCIFFSCVRVHLSIIATKLIKKKC